MTPTEDSSEDGAAGSSAGARRRDLALDVARARAEAALFGGDAGSIELMGLEAPTRIGRFSLRRRLGAGAMGVVYEGHDEMLGRRVAIKLISPDRAGSPSARERMLREAQALAKLSHPNVVPVFEAGIHDGCIFLAMEYVEGRTLRQYAAEQRPGWRALASAYIQAARGLGAAHDAGLVHRDFKPDNAMLGEDGRVRVLDFGLVSAGSTLDAAEPPTLEDDESAARLTRTGAVLGTPAYMAPEQHLQQNVDARADEFAFCVALHEAVYGVRPHDAEGLTGLALAVIEGRLAVPERREPRWLYRVLRRGLATDPARRFPDLHALVRELERGLGRRRGAWVVAGSIALGLGALVGARVLSPSDDPPPAASTDSPAPRAERLAPARQVTRLTDDVQVVGAALSHDGSSIAYWASRANQEWLTIAPTRGGSGVATPRRTGMLAVASLAFNSSGEVLSLQHGFAGIDVVATSAVDGTQQRVRSLQALPRGVSLTTESITALSPDARALAIADRNGKRIFVLDADGGETTLATPEDMVMHMTWSPDAERLAWIERAVEGHRPPRLMIAATDGSMQREAASYAGLFKQPCVGLAFAGNEHLVFAIYGSDSGLDIAKLWEQRLDEQRLGFDGDPQLVQDATPGVPCNVSASDEGRHIAFVRYDRRETIQVAAVLPNGDLEHPRASTIDTTNERIAGWSADGRSVVFFSWREGGPAFYARALDSERATTVFTPRTGNAVLLGHDRDRSIFSDPPPEGGRTARAVSVGPDGSTEVLGAFTDLKWQWSNSCAGLRCTQVVQDGEDTVVYELRWSSDPPRELARVRLGMGEYPHWFLAPDGRQGALFLWDDSVYIVSLTGQPVRRLTVPNKDGGDLPHLQFGAWLPDGSALYITGMYIDGNVYAMIRMDLDGRYELVHAEPNRWLNRPYLAPDGRHIAFGTWNLAGDVWVIER